MSAPPGSGKNTLIKAYAADHGKKVVYFRDETQAVPDEDDE